MEHASDQGGAVGRSRPAAKRADAERNRGAILAAARAALAEAPHSSMAEIARRAGVGMATLYRNFPGRRELLEALYAEQVDGVCAAAEQIEAPSPGAAFTAWLERFLAFSAGKHHLAQELLTQVEQDSPVFNDNRTRVLAAGRPLLAAAQRSGEVREDLSLEQILDMVIAITAIHGDAGYTGPILQAALSGLRPAGSPGVN